MTRKTLSNGVGKDGKKKEDSSNDRGETNVLQGLNPTPPETSDAASEPQDAGQQVRNDEEVPTNEKEPLRQSLTIFMLELQLGIRTINKLNEDAYAEFDRITPDEAVSTNTIEAGELLEMNALLEILESELQRLGQKAKIIAGRFRTSLLDAGVDAAELEGKANKRRQDRPSDEAERLKDGMAKVSKKEIAFRTEIMLTLTAISKLHEVLGSIRENHGPFERIDHLASLLRSEIVKIMKTFDGGELWKILTAQPPK
jgi:hypothetical protein